MLCAVMMRSHSQSVTCVLRALYIIATVDETSNITIVTHAITHFVDSAVVS